MSHCNEDKIIFKLQNVTLGYGRKDQIVKNFSLNIYDGEFVSIIGPNGSGKSTVLRAMAKILTPKSGNILYKDKEINFNLRKYLYQIISHKFKIPISLVTNSCIFELDKTEKLKSNKEIFDSYHLAKMWKKAKDLGFNEQELFISKSVLPTNKLLNKTMKFAKINNITFSEELFYDPSLLETNLEKLELLKKENIKKYKLTILNNFVSKFKPNVGELIYSYKQYKNKYINKMSSYLKRKKVILDSDYYFSKTNCFLDESNLKNNYVKEKIKKLLKWKKLLKLNDEFPIYSFDSYFYTSKEYSRYVAFVPQITNFPSEVTVEEFVKMGRYPHNKILSFFDSELDRKIINDALKNVNLIDLKDKYIEELSGGQKQRAIIALALAQDTNTILLDEPTNHLDIKHQLEIIHLLHDLNHKLNKTIVLVVHDINHGMKFSDKIVVMNKGEIISYGPTNKIINKKIIKDVFGVDAKVELSQNKKIITDYWIENLDLLTEYHKKEDDKQCK